MLVLLGLCMEGSFAQLFLSFLFVVLAMYLFFGFRFFGKSFNDSQSEESACHDSAVQPCYLTNDHVEPIAQRQWKTVLSWVAFHPDEVSSLVDRKGQSALHHACLFRAPADVIETMLHAAPELASVVNEDGELAIHWAIRLSTPHEVIKLLLKANPTSGFIKDNEGNTPLSLLWERHQEKILETWRDGHERLESLHSWKRIMFLFQSHHFGTVWSDDFPQDPTFRPLHAASKCPCPPAFFPLMMRVYKKGIREMDEQGRFPLHIAASCEYANRSCDVMTKIELLLVDYPQAASIREIATGKLPLSIALDAGVAWEDGVHELFKAEPRALEARDRESGLLPFMLAATPPNVPPPCYTRSLKRSRKVEEKTRAETESSQGERQLTTIFSLLRADPEKVRSIP